MALLNDFTTGERIRYYRDSRGLSQKTLGELVGRTENWVYKVERDLLPVDRVTVLVQLARVLRVKDISALTGGFLTADPDGGPDFEHPSVPAIRRAFSLPASRLDPGSGEGLSPVDLAAAVADAWAVYETSTRRYTAVGDLLPVLLGQAYGALRSASPDSDKLLVIRQLVSLYSLLQIWLRRVGEHTLARIAADRALALADDTDDPTLRMVAGWNLSCVFTSSGDVGNSVDLARDLIATCAPGDDASLEQLSAFGALHLQAAVAAVRANQVPVGWDLFTAAGRISERLGGDRNDWHMCFGPTNVAMHSVHLAAEEGNVGEALRRADGVEVDPAFPVERRTRYLIEVMNCNRVQRDDYATVFTLTRLKEQSPEEIAFSPVVRNAVTELLRREKPVWRNELRKVAIHIGLAA